MDRHLSEDEWNAIGSMIAGTQFGVATLAGSLQVAQIFMVLYSLAFFTDMPKDKRQGRRRSILTSLLILVTSSVAVASAMTWKSFRVLYAGGSTGESYFKAYTAIWSVKRTIMTVGDAMFILTPVVGDAFMIWRCLVLWATKRWVTILPIMTCAGTAACGIAYLILDAKGNRLAASKALIGASCLSVATNLVATGLILLRLALTWRDTSTVFPDCKRHMYTSVSAIVIESAAPVAILGVCWIAIKSNTLSRQHTLVESVRL